MFQFGKIKIRKSPDGIEFHLLMILTLSMPLLYLRFTAKSEFHYSNILIPKKPEELINHNVHLKKLEEGNTLVTMTIFIETCLGAIL